MVELINSARVAVFLLDEHQVVRPGELGTVAAITETAKRMGLNVVQVDLDAQFRCGGSRAYEEWVLRLLGLTPGGPVQWDGDDKFELRVVSSAPELEEFFRLKASEGYNARITAGFCWPWHDPRPDGTLVPMSSSTTGRGRGT